MGLDTNKRQEVIYFTGTEVENTAMKGERTLFVVGIQPVEEIVSRLKEHNIKHAYFGTSQSFAPESIDDWNNWTTMLVGILDLGYVATLDYDVFYVKEVLECGFDEYDNFINMISVKLPYIKQFNYNATLKLDDNTWGDTNSGVWCHSIHSLMDRRVYTDWRDYVGDEVID